MAARDGYKRYLESDVWAEKREAARLRALGRCEFCGAAMNHVHHVRYPKRLGDESLDDLVAVCEGCHKKSHGVREMNIQPIPDGRVVELRAPNGRPFPAATSENGNAYASLPAWMDAIEVPSFKRAQFDVTVQAYAMQTAAGRLPRGTFNGQTVYSWQTIAEALRAADRKYHKLIESPRRPDDMPLEHHQPMLRFVKNIDAMTRWGWDLQSQALAARIKGQEHVTVQTAPGNILEYMQKMAAGFVHHDTRISTLESATKRPGEDSITVVDGCLELNLDELLLIQGGQNLAQFAGNQLKKGGCESRGKVERRPHGISARISTNLWARRDVYRILGELTGRDFSGLLLSSLPVVKDAGK